MSDKENDLIREDTVAEPETGAAAAADNSEGAERDAAPSEPAAAENGKKRKKPREKFSVWFKRNRKKIAISLISVLSVGVLLAVILVPTHFATLNEPGDYIDLPVARLSLDSAVTVEKSGSYIAHPDHGGKIGQLHRAPRFRLGGRRLRTGQDHRHVPSRTRQGADRHARE